MWAATGVAERGVDTLRRQARLRALLRRLPPPRLRALLRQSVSWIPNADPPASISPAATSTAAGGAADHPAAANPSVAAPPTATPVAVAGPAGPAWRRVAVDVSASELARRKQVRLGLPMSNL